LRVQQICWTGHRREELSVSGPSVGLREEGMEREEGSDGGRAGGK